ncbi:hypothetical protein Tco_0753995 [Tanacetum coccineum]
MTTKYCLDIPIDGPIRVEMVNVTKDNFDEDDLVKFQELLLDAEKPLYEECPDFTKLSAIAKLLNLKVEFKGLGVRKQKKAFNKQQEFLPSPIPITGEQIYNEEPQQKKRSFKPSERTQRAYWKKLQHLESNLGKTKDGVNARLDLVELGVKLELFAMQEEDKTTLPPAGYTLKNAEKDTFCETLHTSGFQRVHYVKDHIDKKLSIVFKTHPKNYKDTYDEVDEEFSTVIHQHNDNILPRVDRRDLGNESRNGYYRTDCGGVVIRKSK